MGEVVIGNFITSLACPPDRVLESAVGKVDSAVVIGFDKDGEFYFASSEPSGPEVLWLLKLAEKKLMEIGDSE